MQNNFLFLALKLLVLVAICLKTAKAQTPADTLPINNSIVVTGKANSYVPKISVGTPFSSNTPTNCPLWIWANGLATTQILA